MDNFLCQQCYNQLRIKEGDYLFSYNINCSNNHESKNIDLESLLSKRNFCEIIYKCNHKNKSSYIHCFECDEDICFGCYNKLHKQHKMDYLKNLNFDEVMKYNFEERLKKDKIIFDTFFTQIKQFEKQLNTYIQIFKSEMKKYYQFRCELIKNIRENNFTYIDIENVKNNFDTDSDKFINDNMKKMSHCDTFLKRYDHLKNIFEFIIKRGKYIQEQNIKILENNKNNINNIIPINDKYFIQNSHYSFKIIRTNFNCKTPIHDIIFEYNYNFNKIILKNIDNFENEFSFYHLGNYQLNEVTIKNILNFKKKFNENIIIKNIKTFNDTIIDLLILSPNKNIIFTQFSIYLYDDLFMNKKLISNNYYKTYDLLKLNENEFVYTTCDDYYSGIYPQSNLYIIKFVGDIIEKKIFNNCGYKLIYYYKKEKILFSHDTKYIYLFNLNIPELIQKLRRDNNYEISNFEIILTNYNHIIKYFMNYNDDSIYFEIIEKIFRDFSFYDITFLVQYKFIEKELIEISRIEINSKKLLHYKND